MFSEACAGLAAMNKDSWTPVAFQTWVYISRRKGNPDPPLDSAQLEVVPQASSLGEGRFLTASLGQQRCWRVPHPTSVALTPSRRKLGSLSLTASFFPGGGTSVGLWKERAEHGLVLRRTPGAWILPHVLCPR